MFPARHCFMGFIAASCGCAACRDPAVGWAQCLLVGPWHHMELTKASDPHNHPKITTCGAIQGINPCPSEMRT